MQNGLHCKKKGYNTEPLRFRAVLPNYFKFRGTKMVPLHSYETVLSSENLRRFRNLTTKPTRSFSEHIQNFQWFRLISKSFVEIILNHSWFRKCSKSFIYCVQKQSWFGNGNSKVFCYLQGEKQFRICYSKPADALRNF